MINGDEKSHLVDIGGQYMTLFAQVRSTTDDIILPLFYLLDPIGAISQRLYFHMVSDGHRVRATDAPDAEIAFDMTFRIRAIVQTNDVTATRRFDD